MENEIQKTNNEDLSFSAEDTYLSAVAFKVALKMAHVLSGSTMVPAIFQGNQANCLIALNLANRVKADPLMVMQKIYIINGKPAMEAQLQTALLQASGRFEPLKYVYSNEGTDDWSCYAASREIKTGEIVKGPKVSIKMAKDEGWYGKKGSKWPSLPELMLAYRAASFFISIHDPACRMGLITREEAQDARQKTPQDVDVIVHNETPEERQKKESVEMYDDLIKSIDAAKTIDELDEIKSKNWPNLKIQYEMKADQAWLLKLEQLEAELKAEAEAQVQEESGEIVTDEEAIDSYFDAENGQKTMDLGGRVPQDTH